MDDPQDSPTRDSPTDERAHFWNLVRIAVRDAGVPGDDMSDRTLLILDLLALTDDPRQRLILWLKDAHHVQGAPEGRPEAH